MPVNPSRKKKNPVHHLIAGGFAGFVESSVCHPLDTIKTRMQLRRQVSTFEAIKARSSLTEPALRLQHSLMEPIHRVRNSLMEPAYHRHDHQFKVVTGRNTSAAASGILSTTTPVHEPSSIRIPMLNDRHQIPKSNPEMAKATGAVIAPMGPVGTARRIIQREGFLALYKGLSAVYTGIIPKMAIRFVSFEQYKEWLAATSKSAATTTPSIVFAAGLASGLTEAVLVVTPAEVCKIRMQSQYNSMMDPHQMAKRKYTNVFQTGLLVMREEGIGALYKGVVPTMLRQGCNQAVNFTAYQYLKTQWMMYTDRSSLASHESLIMGGLSGGMGPLVNNPLDVVKTRLQKQVVLPGKAPKYKGLIQGCRVIAAEEGVLALWKGITARLLRIVPGQAITFMTYEFVSSKMERYKIF